jgi:hypothetical protein
MASLLLISTTEEYSQIMQILNKKPVEFKGRYVKMRMKEKSKLFEIINTSLYFVNDAGSKMVIVQTDEDIMKIEAKKLHELSHFGVNKLEDHTNALFFKIKRKIIGGVVSDCLTCAQALPLKQYDIIKNFCC